MDGEVITLISGDKEISTAEGYDSFFDLEDRERNISINFTLTCESEKLTVYTEYHTGELTPDFTYTFIIVNHLIRESTIKRVIKKNYKHNQNESFQLPDRLTESNGFVKDGLITLSVSVVLRDNIIIRSQNSSTVTSRLNSPKIPKFLPEKEINIQEIKESIPKLQLDIPKRQNEYKDTFSDSDSDIIEVTEIKKNHSVTSLTFSSDSSDSFNYIRKNSQNFDKKSQTNKTTEKPQEETRILQKNSKKDDDESDSFELELENDEEIKENKKEIVSKFETSSDDITFNFNSQNDTKSDILYSIVTAPYSGLINRGTTCYINVWLQILFHLPIFRLYVFKSDNENESEFLNCLRRLFYKMMIEPKNNQNPKQLIDSFGWDTGTLSMQHDSIEFFTLLISSLPNSLKKIVDDLFAGKLKQKIYKDDKKLTKSIQDFMTLSLDVKTSQNLTESLQKFSEKAKLQDYNGQRDCEMETTIKRPPKILIIHLNRFSYDENGVNKLNDEFKFDEKFIYKTAEYQLFSVIVHSGSPNSGHYYCYIRPQMKNDFVLFNDTDVKFCSKTEMIENNFGGKSFSAYVLVYISTIEINSIFVDFDINEIDKSKFDEMLDLNVFFEKDIDFAAKSGYLSYINRFPLHMKIPISETIGNIIPKLKNESKIDNLPENDKYLSKIVSDFNEERNLYLKNIEEENLRYFSLESEISFGNELQKSDNISVLEGSKGIIILENFPKKYIFPVLIYEPSLICPLRLFKILNLDDIDIKVSDVISMIFSDTSVKIDNISLSVSNATLSFKTLINSQKLSEINLKNGQIFVLSSKTIHFDLDETVKNSFSFEDRCKFNISFDENQNNLTFDSYHENLTNCQIYPKKLSQFMSIMKESFKITLTFNNEITKDVYLLPDCQFGTFYDILQNIFGKRYEISKEKTTLFFFTSNSFSPIYYKLEDLVRKCLFQNKTYKVMSMNGISLVSQKSFFRVIALVVNGPIIVKESEFLVTSLFTVDGILDELLERNIISSNKYKVLVMKENVFRFADETLYVSYYSNPFRICNFLSKDVLILTVFYFTRENSTLREYDKKLPFPVEIKPADTFLALREKLREKYQLDTSGKKLFKISYGIYGNIEASSVNDDEYIMKSVNIERERVGIEIVISNTLRLHQL